MEFNLFNSNNSEIFSAPRSNKPRRKNISQSLKKLVLQNQTERCADCNKQLTPKIMHFDHILPISEGGDNSIENIQALCSNCHSIKTHTENKKKVLRRKSNGQKNNDGPGMWPW